jgi:hypothetical protein
MDDYDDALVAAVEQLSRVQNRGDFQISDGAQGDSGATGPPSPRLARRRPCHEGRHSTGFCSSAQGRWPWERTMSSPTSFVR